jgi:hypothetical protein
MADQSASRPKWIPSYAMRSINGKEHVTKWSTALFLEGETAVDEETFRERLLTQDYAPPLGGPYVGASSSAFTDTSVITALFDVLADGKKTLTKGRLSMRWKQLADGEEGLTWQKFSQALGIGN